MIVESVKIFLLFVEYICNELIFVYENIKIAFIQQHSSKGTPESQRNMLSIAAKQLIETIL